MSPFLRFLFASHVSLVLTGCAFFPAPRTVLVVPGISGRVVRDAQAVSGVKVSYQRVISAAGCDKAHDSALTDHEGAFSIPRREEFRFWAVVAGDPSNRWGICLYPQGGPVLGWVGRGLGVPPERATFECNLSASEAESGGGFGICRRVGI